MAEDLISTTVELICKDSKNLNKIHDLLKDLESDSESEVVNSAEILFQVFLYHINGGTWTNKLLSNNNKSKKDDKTNEASKTVALWLSSSYTAFVQLLTRKIFYGSSEFQCKLLHFFVDIVNADFSFAMKNRNKPVKEAIQENFPVAFIMLVKEFMLNDLLSNENLSEDLMSLLQFLDISYFILKSIEKVFNDKNEENTNMGTKELENTLKLLLVASKNVSGIIDEDPLLHAEKFLNNNESLCGKITNNLKKSYKSAFTNTWLLLLRQNNMTSIVRKKILVELDSKVMPFLKDPTLLIDFLTDSFNEGGVSSILALNGLFVLINQHNLDYPDFYNKLYTIIDSTIFHMKYKARFFYLIDLFLSSTHLPAYLIAAFVKKFARMLLFAPAPDQMLLLTFIKNMLIRHPSCRVLIHRKKVLHPLN